MTPIAAIEPPLASRKLLHARHSSFERRAACEAGRRGLEYIMNPMGMSPNDYDKREENVLLLQNSLLWEPEDMAH